MTHDLTTEIPGVLYIKRGNGKSAPVIFDSPHSGNVYPEDFAHSCPRDKILWGEDAFVDNLFDHTPGHGAWFLHRRWHGGR